jgi:regulator of replication initiation timing
LIKRDMYEKMSKITITYMLIDIFLRLWLGFCVNQKFLCRLLIFLIQTFLKVSCKVTMPKKRIVQDRDEAGGNEEDKDSSSQVAKKSKTSDIEIIDKSCNDVIRMATNLSSDYKNQKLLIEKLLIENKQLKKENDLLKSTFNPIHKVLVDNLLEENKKLKMENDWLKSDLNLIHNIGKQNDNEMDMEKEEASEDDTKPAAKFTEKEE